MKTLMLAAIRCFLMFTAVAVLSIAYHASVQAVPTTYQYTGNPFTYAYGVYTNRTRVWPFAVPQTQSAFPRRAFSRSPKSNRVSCASASVRAQDDSYRRVARSRVLP